MPEFRRHPKIVAALWNSLHAEPFERFAVRLQTGETLAVDDPDVLTVTLSGRVFYDVGKGRVQMVNPAVIASVDFPDNASETSLPDNH